MSRREYVFFSIIPLFTYCCNFLASRVKFVMGLFHFFLLDVCVDLSGGYICVP